MNAPETTYPETQRRVEDACAAADRLAETAEQEAARLRDARRERTALERELEELKLADPRALAAAKSAAHETYRHRMRRAAQSAEVVGATYTWLNEIDRLNRASTTAAGRAKAAAGRLRETETLVDRLELTARAAAVSAASARQACLEARRALARQDEAITGRAAAERPLAQHRTPLLDGGMAPLDALLGGDRAAFSALVGGVAEEIGLDASRLQLLLLELREAIVAQAFDAAAFDFPAGHPFWGQFSLGEARAVAAALATLGRGYDGRAGWLDDRPAEPRELALALSLAGRDPRTLRYRPTGADIATLWQGATVAAADHLHERAPDLGLEQVVGMLGARAEGLAELWDNWGRMRRLLLSRASAA